MADAGRTPRIYTRTGDRGETGLAGGGRVSKTSARIEAFGSLDELGAHLGEIRSGSSNSDHQLLPLLTRLQNEIFVAQAELASPPGRSQKSPQIGERHVRRLESEIDQNMPGIDPLHAFVLPGGSVTGAALHVARTVCRRAERAVWRLNEAEPVRPELLAWLNRLGDLLFALALATNRTAGAKETAPDYSV